MHATQASLQAEVHKSINKVMTRVTIQKKLFSNWMQEGKSDYVEHCSGEGEKGEREKKGEMRDASIGKVKVLPI